MKQPSGGNIRTWGSRYVFLCGSVLALLGLSLLHGEAHPYSFLTLTNLPGIVCRIIFDAFLAVSAVALIFKLMHWKDYSRTFWKQPGVVKASCTAFLPVACGCVLTLIDRGLLRLIYTIRLCAQLESNPKTFGSSMIYMSLKGKDMLFTGIWTTVRIALLGTGIAFVTRLAPNLAVNQVIWLFVSVAAMVATLAFVPSLDELADYIQMQASVKRSDCKAVLDELGMAMKHYFELGQKVKIEGIGIFKVGITSSPSDTEEGCTAANVKKSRVLFAPETTSTPTGETATVQRPALVNGVPTVVDYEVSTYSHPATMLKDVRFELAQNATGSGITPSGDDSGGGDGGDDEPRP